MIVFFGYLLTTLITLILADHSCAVVVLLLQVNRIYGHVLLHPAEEQPPDHIPARLSSCHHAQHLVVRHELGAMWPL